MKKTNKRAVGIQVSRKKTAAKRAEEPIDLAKMIPKLGRLSVSESKKKSRWHPGVKKKNRR